MKRRKNINKYTSGKQVTQHPASRDSKRLVTALTTVAMMISAAGAGGYAVGYNEGEKKE